MMNRLNGNNIKECSDESNFLSDDESFGDDEFPQENPVFTAGVCVLNDSRKKIRKLEDLLWFHGDMTRNTAEALLLANGVEGTYLLRNSKNHPGGYTVSVRCQHSLKHFSLVYNQYTNVYKFGMGQFDSLGELLEHFDCMPVLETETGSSVTLQFPYLNNIPEPTTYEYVTRHAEFGKTSAMNKKCDEVEPDLHIASKEGYLIKRGAIHKNWKKRWFVLQKHLLQYFKDTADKAPIRTIDLHDADIVSEDFTDDKRNCFRLVTSKRTFYFVAPTPQDAKSWIELLKWKIQYYYDRSQSNSAVDSTMKRLTSLSSHSAYLAQYTKL